MRRDATTDPEFRLFVIPELRVAPPTQSSRNRASHPPLSHPGTARSAVSGIQKKHQPRHHGSAWLLDSGSRSPGSRPGSLGRNDEEGACVEWQEKKPRAHSIRKQSSLSWISWVSWLNILSVFSVAIPHYCHSGKRVALIRNPGNCPPNRIRMSHQVHQEATRGCLSDHAGCARHRCDHLARRRRSNREIASPASSGSRAARVREHNEVIHFQGDAQCVGKPFRRYRRTAMQPVHPLPGDNDRRLPACPARPGFAGRQAWYSLGDVADLLAQALEIGRVGNTGRRGSCAFEQQVT